jgi:hypothetical protein
MQRRSGRCSTCMLTCRACTVCSRAGMFAAVFLLGEVSLHVRELPLVHSWHEKVRPLPLLASSAPSIGRQPQPLPT